MRTSFRVKVTKLTRKILPQWSKNTAFLIAGIIIGISGVAFANPGHIVQKSLSLVGINTDTEQTLPSEQVAQSNQAKEKESGDTTSSDADASDKADATKPKSPSEQSQPKPTGRDSGSTSIITPEEYQAHADNGETKLIARQDWDVKINSRSPSSCGTSSNPCSVGQQAKVNVSAYNTHTNELLPITECNGTAAAIHASSNLTPTTLPDKYHCELTFTPTNAGQYWFQIELYLSTSVYTDTIYWGGWVWGGASDSGYFVN